MGAEKKIAAGGLSQAEIDRLKKKYGPITLISLIDDESDDVQHFWFKKPTMEVMAALSTLDEIRGTQIYFKNCLIHGDEKAADDVDVFVNIGPHLQRLIKTFNVEVKNF